MVSEMKVLFDAISDLVFLLSEETIQAIASRLKEAEKSNVQSALVGAVSSPAARRALTDVLQTCVATDVSPHELALMLLATAHAHHKISGKQQIELVWTGPTTSFVSARRTEQVLLQVINSARETLFITSFVAYDISNVVTSINAAIERGVAVNMLLESSQSHGGSIEIDVIGKMQSLIPKACFYAWRNKDDEFSGGRVHAKVAVADKTSCFITSANLTGYAMERNMEAGVLISGGQIPRLLDDHLRSLIDTKTVSAT
jgi:phosphatidylserine/phosphatidylglycerophosphate/cardiolipin synthase-like enzyme